MHGVLGQLKADHHHGDRLPTTEQLKASIFPNSLCIHLNAYQHTILALPACTLLVLCHCRFSQLVGSLPDQRSVTVPLKLGSNSLFAGRDGTAADALVVAVTEEHGRQGGATTPLTPPPLPAARTGTHWLLTTALMMSDMFGLGALSLPADFARLGWLPGLACMACFTTTNAYAGIIYQRLILKVPQAVIFDEIGAAAYGQLGKVLVYGTVYLTILCEPVMFQLMCMEALQQVSSPSLSQVIVCLMLLSRSAIVNKLVPGHSSMVEQAIQHCWSVMA